ncbi:cytochrome c oxidase subunit 4 [Streptacidiphilus monticola]|uniref:cytochrome-c oxidase n=1 Tax=Streptacidiphilus monticola TaxID=2161674 RepID=A0ABW1G7C0_9ACTN
MRSEALLWTGVAFFFAVCDGIYLALAHENAGKAALTVALLMSSLVAAFLWINYGRRGARAQDRPAVPVSETAGPLEFFPPSSGYPVITAAGVAFTALAPVFEPWLALVGLGLLAAGVGGFVFQYSRRGE